MCDLLQVHEVRKAVEAIADGVHSPRKPYRVPPSFPSLLVMIIPSGPHIALQGVRKAGGASRSR